VFAERVLEVKEGAADEGPAEAGPLLLPLNESGTKDWIGAGAGRTGAGGGGGGCG
jgi:hypothetical protein